MNRIPIGLLALATIAGLCLAACAGPLDDPAPVPSPAADRGRALNLDESRWELQTLNGAPLLSGTSITARFVNGVEMGGEVDCNSYGTTYSTGDGGEFRLTGRVHHTEFACDRSAQADSQEVAYYEALARVASYGVVTIDDDPPALTFYNEAGVPLLAFHEREAPRLDAALAGDWLLQELNGDPLLPGTQIRLAFAQDRYDVLVDGFSGCNFYGGPALQAMEGLLRMEQVEMTARDCPAPAGVMLQEKAYQDALQAAATYEVSDDTLIIAGESGEVLLRFRRQEDAVADAEALPGSAWRLNLAFGEPPAAETVVVFLDDSLGLARYDGCAGYLFSYRAGGDDADDFRIFGSQALPNVGCPDPGEALQYVLPDAFVHSFGLEGDYLILLFENGHELVYGPLPDGAPLEGGDWRLLAFVTVEELDVPFPRVAAPQPDLPPRLRFEAGTVQGHAGCNDFSAPYEVGDGALAVGDLVVTDMLCEGPAELMAQEERFLAELAQAGRALVAGDLLWIETGENNALLFDRTAGD